MKKAATLFLLMLSSCQILAQVRIYKDNKLQAEGLFVGTAVNVIHVRTFDGTNIAKRSFFQNVLDSIVVLDSASIAEIGATPFRCHLVLRNERPVYDFEKTFAPKVDSNIFGYQSVSSQHVRTEREIRLQKAEKHADKAQASLVGAISFGLLSAVLIRELDVRAAENNSFSPAVLIGALSGAVGFVFLLNAVDQHSKAKSYRTID